jgi:hypothetical protein
MRALTPLLIVAAVLLAAAYRFSNPETHWRPGVLAPDEPLQTTIDNGAPFTQKEFRVTPRASFSAKVRVLHTESYWFGALAKVSPVDFAVGWGQMSDSAVLKSFDISQSGRFFFWRASDLPLPREEIERSASNWHMIPANDSVLKKLTRVHTGDIVTISGQLVDLVDPDGGTINTSLVRTDTGAGACEVIWVESVQTIYR